MSDLFLTSYQLSITSRPDPPSAETHRFPFSLLKSEKRFSDKGDNAFDKNSYGFISREVFFSPERNGEKNNQLIADRRRNLPVKPAVSGAKETNLISPVLSIAGKNLSAQFPVLKHITTLAPTPYQRHSVGQKVKHCHRLTPTVSETGSYVAQNMALGNPHIEHENNGRLVSFRQYKKSKCYTKNKEFPREFKTKTPLT